MLLVSSLYFSQSNLSGFDLNSFVGKDLALLKDKYLVALPRHEKLQEFGYEYFYTSEEMNRTDRYKSPNGYSGSNYADVAGKKFLLTDFKKVDKTLGDYILFLKDEEGNSVYFLYDSKIATRFPFQAAEPIVFPEEFYCSKIDVKKDKFTDKTTKYSPLLEPVSFVKENGYFISLEAYGAIAVVNGTGLILLLSNGQKINKKVKIDVEVDSSGQFRYTAFTQLTQADISLLTKYTIDDFKLHIFENKQLLNGEAYKQYLKCLIK